MPIKSLLLRKPVITTNHFIALRVCLSVCLSVSVCPFAAVMANKDL